MMDQICQNGPGMLLVISHLGAAIRMGKSNHILHSSLNISRSLLCNGSRHVIHTAYCRDDPDLISHSHCAVGTHKALEGSVRCPFVRRFHRFIGIVKQLSQRRTQVVGVNPVSCLDILLGTSDAIAIFYHIFSLFNIPDRHFVSGWDVLQCRYLTGRSCFLSFHTCRNRNFCSCGNRLQCHHYSIIFVDPYEILHNAALIPFALMSSRSAVTASESPGT